MRKAQIPLMTVKASAAAALVQRIVVPTGSYQLRTVTDGDVATIYVDAELKPGLIFVVK